MIKRTFILLSLLCCLSASAQTPWRTIDSLVETKAYADAYTMIRQNYAYAKQDGTITSGGSPVPLFVYVQRGTVGKSLRVGLVEGFHIHLAHPDAEIHGHQSPQEFAAGTGLQRGGGQLVQTVILPLVHHRAGAHLPYRVIVHSPEPRGHHVADAEPAVLHPEELPCALQPPPERHKAFLVILNRNHSRHPFKPDIFSNNPPSCSISRLPRRRRYTHGSPTRGACRRPRPLSLGFAASGGTARG